MNKMNKFKALFPNNCSVIGMVHLSALPGSPLSQNSVQKIVDNACKETEIYLKYSLDGILVENMHDIPYVQSRFLKPETTATMTRVCTEVKKLIGVSKTPCGVQVLAAGNEEALAISKACELQFIRAEGFVFSHVADEGFIDANAGTLLRYRRTISAENVLIFTDIKKKHSSHAITADVSLTETAKAAEFFLSDGIILTGTSTGSAADTEELQALKTSTSLPILIGSGVTETNLEQYLSADALIIGSHFKRGGFWINSIDEERVKRFMNKINMFKKV